MAKIDRKRLKQLRENKGWTQNELADHTKFGRYPKIDKRTISRLEQGKQASTHSRTLQQLARALGVEQAVLTGDAPIPESKLQNQIASQSTIQISSNARNALYLIYERYHIPPWQVIEFAPFLLCWAAEASLRQRRHRVDELERTYQALRDREQHMKHMRESETDDLQEKIRVERESIESRDMFGYRLEDAGFVSYRYDWIENPFARFLDGLAEDFSDVLEFQGFSSIDYPDFVVCREEAVRIVGGDELLGTRIIEGSVSLSEMPDHIRDSNDSAARAVWVREKANEFLMRIANQSPHSRKGAST